MFKNSVAFFENQFQTIIKILRTDLEGKKELFLNALVFIHLNIMALLNTKIGTCLMSQELYCFGPLFHKKFGLKLCPLLFSWSNVFHFRFLILIHLYFVFLTVIPTIMTFRLLDVYVLFTYCLLNVISFEHNQSNMHLWDIVSIKKGSCVMMPQQITFVFLVIWFL